MTDAQLTYTVQLDVSGGSFGSGFTSTDVTSKAAAGLGFEPITVTWGRQDQYSNVNPTTVSGSLLNTDGLFSPGNASSTYYPHIKRGLRRRVIVGVNATTVNVSEDYATSLEVVPAHDSPAVTNVEGADILARYGGTTSASDAASAPSVGTTMRSFLAEDIMTSATLVSLFMLQEADGATSFADVTGTSLPLTVENSKYGAGTVAAGTAVTGFVAGTMVTLTNANYGTSTRGGSWLTGTMQTVASPYTVEIWVQMPSTKPASVPATILNIGGSVVLEVLTTGQIQFGTGGAGAITSSAAYCDGKVHQIGLAVTGGVATLYIDGASVGTSAYSTATGGSITVGATDDGLGGSNLFTGSVSHLAIFSTAFSLGSMISSNYTAGTTAFAGERTDQRISRLLTYRPGTGSLLDTGLGTMGTQDIAGRSLQDCLVEVGQTEGGVVFIDGTGRVNFRSRSWLFNPTPSVTLDMSVGGIDFGSNWREDTQNVVNDATVTNTTTGSDQRYFSSSSITADGEYATSLSLPLNADADALNMAGWIVANGTQQQLVATPLIVNLLHLTAAQAQAVLQIKPLDCIRLTNCPSPAPSATMTFIVQGGATSLAADAASVTLNLTPLPYPVGVWDSTNWDAAGVTWAF